MTVRTSPFERRTYAVLWLMLTGALTTGLLLGWEPRPDAEKLLSGFGTMAVLLFIVLKSFRYELRLDDREFVYRCWITKSIPLDQVKTIRVAREHNFIKWIPFLKVELAGGDQRILVSWREGKMRPLVRALRNRFGDRVEEVGHIPNA